MWGFRRLSAWALFAAVSTTSIAFAQNDLVPRNCPLVRDQTVGISPGVARQFEVSVINPAGATITPFQYPAGGILQQTGPFEFVFVPRVDFNGTTSFTYRLHPPFGCPQGVLLGTVHLVGGAAGSALEGTDTTATGLVEPPVDEPDVLGDAIDTFNAVSTLINPCGVGFALPLTAMLALLFTRGRRG